MELAKKTAHRETKIYTDEEISALTSEGYLKVHPSLWDHIPAGAHIRYIKKDDGSGKERRARFRLGGFVRNHFADNDKKMMTIETKPNGQRGDVGYLSYRISYDTIELLWKKYDKFSFIEIHLIHNSLAQKKQKIEELEKRTQRLEDILRSIVAK